MRNAAHCITPRLTGRMTRHLTRGLLCCFAMAGLSACNSEPQAQIIEPIEVAAPTVPQDTDTRAFLTPDEAALAASDGLLPANIKSVLKVDRTMRHGQYEWQESDVPDGPLQVRVDLDRQLVSAFRGGHEIGTAVILYGAEGNDTPTGRFPIQRKIKDYYSRTYNNAPMPFTLWLTDDGVALHGSKVAWGAATHGCVGVPLGFAKLLFEVAETGNVIEIVGRKGNAA